MPESRDKADEEVCIQHLETLTPAHRFKEPEAVNTCLTPLNVKIDQQE